MKAIILCAGMGTRLEHYTHNRPKCMVEFYGRPLLNWQLKVLNACGVEEIILVGGYKAELLSKFGQKVVINPRYKDTNMLYSLLQAKEEMISGDDILISYGDIIYEPRIIKDLLMARGDIVIAADADWRKLWSARFRDPLEDAETFKMDSRGYLEEIGNSPDSYDRIDAQYRGLIKLSSNYASRFFEIIDIYRENNSVNKLEALSMTEMLMYMIRKGEEIDVSMTRGGWLEFDNVSDLNLYAELEKAGSLSSHFDMGVV